MNSDVAVLLLSKKIMTVAPSPMAKTGDMPTVGDPITMVGYGVTGWKAEDSEKKRFAQNVISSVTSEVFMFDGAGGTSTTTCSGDSGGPTFAMRQGVETLIGVHTASETGCQDRGIDTRVDVMYGWIMQKKQWKQLYGTRCTSGDDCISGICLGAGKGTSDAFCTVACDAYPCPRAADCVSAVGMPGIS